MIFAFSLCLICQGAKFYDPRNPTTLNERVLIFGVSSRTTKLVKMCHNALASTPQQLPLTYFFCCRHFSFFLFFPTKIVSTKNGFTQIEISQKWFPCSQFANSLILRTFFLNPRRKFVRPTLCLLHPPSSCGPIWKNASRVCLWVDYGCGNDAGFLFYRIWLHWPSILGVLACAACEEAGPPYAATR